VGERSRILQSDKQGIFFEAIGGHAGGAAVDNGANRDGDPVFGHVLVNHVVCEASECFDGFSYADFDFGNTR
jgi:hypothetical protein